MRTIASGVHRTGNARKNTRKRWSRKSVSAVKDLVTCRHCGIVPRGHQCQHRKSRQKSGDRQSDSFRKTKAWTLKSMEIRQRDRYLCQCCLNNLYNTIEWLNYKTVEVHHIVPLQEDYSLRLDNDNLVSLCSYHHKMADKGDIPRKVLYDIVHNIHKNV